MIAVGLLLVALAVVVLVGLVSAPGGSTDAHFFGLILPNLSARALVLLGLATGLLFAIGLGSVRRRLARFKDARTESRSFAQPPAPRRDDDPFLLGD
jgi:hypothetical protein